MTSSLLRIEGLSVTLPTGADRALAVDDVSLTVQRGEIVCVIGESGSGKSITANAVMGLLPRPHVRPVGGRILFEGEDLLALSGEAMRDFRGRRAGMIFQEPMTALNPLMRIGDQLVEVFASHNVLTPASRLARAVELFREVGLPEPESIGAQYPFRLSGGQRQRVMIAIALALEPALLIADEPTTALDVTTQAQILKLIRDLQRRKDMGVMFITHDFGVVAEIADRIVVMQHGRIVEHGDAPTILTQPAHDYTKRLLAAVPSLTPPPPRSLPAGPPVLEVATLDKTYRSGGGIFARRRVVPAVCDVSLRVGPGETLGLVGESGSGKSTLGRCIARLMAIDGGHIRFKGQDLAALSGAPLRRVRRTLQMVFQDPFASLNPRHKVGVIIAEGLVAHGVSWIDALNRARELMPMVGLEPHAADRYPHEFSGGQRQRIGIARALALDPDVLIADEPVSALDVSVQEQVLALLKDLRQRLGLAMIFITHDLRVAAQIADRIAVMRLGRIVEEAPTQDLFRAPQHAYTRDLLAAVPGRRMALGGAQPAAAN
ncbi:MAG: ABC transporter ATP-binding protein [Alphaproteobacteria bacterium]|nr:ABC transporter ATP-binding protein [Alphaproteobacteria bacterium]